MRRLGSVLLTLVVLIGCGGDDDEGAGPTQTKPPKSGEKAKVPPGLSGEERKAAQTVAAFLNEASGIDACFAWVASDYVDSLGGQKRCAKLYDPLVTGDFSEIRSVRIVEPGARAVAVVAPEGDGEPVDLKLAMATTGWRVDGASGLPR